MSLGKQTLSKILLSSKFYNISVPIYPLFYHMITLVLTHKKRTRNFSITFEILILSI